MLVTWTLVADSNCTTFLVMYQPVVCCFCCCVAAGGGCQFLEGDGSLVSSVLRAFAGQVGSLCPAS